MRHRHGAAGNRQGDYEVLAEAGASVAICGRRDQDITATVAEMNPPIRGNVIGKAVDLRINDEVATSSGS